MEIGFWLFNCIKQQKYSQLIFCDVTMNYRFQKNTHLFFIFYNHLNSYKQKEQSFSFDSIDDLYKKLCYFYSIVPSKQIYIVLKSIQKYKNLITFKSKIKELQYNHPK